MIRTACVLALLSLPAQAVELPPAAERAVVEVEDLGSYRVPIGPWSEEGVPTLDAEGRIVREAWHVPGDATTLELLAPLREQLAADGYSTLFECEADICGGFDFRFETEILPEPDMHVDLGDFRFLATRRGDAGAPADIVTVLVSRTRQTGFVQVVRVGAAAASVVAPPERPAAPAPGPAAPAAAPSGPLAPASGDLARRLEETGRTVLSDLAFETGSSRLAEGPYRSLEALAAYLRDNPDRRVTLVGHTDADGSLEANVALSRARARAVRERLVTEFGIPGSQVEADGVGYLMPLATNLTEAGRTANRRVEAVLTATE